MIRTSMSQTVSTCENPAPVPAGNNTRLPLGQGNRVEINQTLLRVVGKDSKTPALDVAAFQSFAD